MATPEPREIRFRDSALAEGLSDDALGRLVRRGEWSRLRRGAYLPGPNPMFQEDDHLLRVHATMRGLRRAAVVSHQSAAVLHGLPLWRVPLDKVHITRTPGASTTGRGEIRCHVARLRDEDIVQIGHLQVTSLIRTVLDLARSLSFESAVVLADRALHKKLVDHEHLRQRLFDLVGVPGTRAAARVVAFADYRSESVGESRSRVALHKVGLTPPTLQLSIGTSLGETRVDFAWERERVVGEFDGQVKYGRLLRPGQDPGQAVFDEKRREDAIRDENWGVVRWTWSELAHPLQLGRRLERALERGPGVRD